MERFYKLKNKTTILPALKSLIANTSTSWYHKNAFDIAMVPKSITETDPTVTKLIERFNAQPVILKMNPMTFYRFHVDEFRNAALNLLVDGWDSETFYGEPTDNEELTALTALTYEQEYFFLLNTGKPHCVINRNNPRYVFSLGFNDPLTYDMVVNFCREKDL